MQQQITDETEKLQASHPVSALEGHLHAEASEATVLSPCHLGDAGVSVPEEKCRLRGRRRWPNTWEAQGCPPPELKAASRPPGRGLPFPGHRPCTGVICLPHTSRKAAR